MIIQKVAKAETEHPVLTDTEHKKANKVNQAEPRKLGMLEGMIKVHGDLKDPLPASIAAKFGI